MNNEVVKEAYTTGADDYDSLMSEEWDATTPRREVVSSLALKPGQSLLDVCVGTGLNMPHYPGGIYVTGIDITDAMMEVAQKRAQQLSVNVTFRNMDARHLDFSDEHFDGVLATYALSVVPEPKRCLEEIARVTKRGGRIAIWDSVLSDVPGVAKNQRVLSYFTSKYGFPEGKIVFDLTVNFPQLIDEIPRLRIERFTRYDREDPLKSRCLIECVRV